VGEIKTQKNIEETNFLGVITLLKSMMHKTRVQPGKKGGSASLRAKRMGNSVLGRKCGAKPARENQRKRQRHHEKKKGVEKLRQKGKGL